MQTLAEEGSAEPPTSSCRTVGFSDNHFADLSTNRCLRDWFVFFLVQYSKLAPEFHQAFQRGDKLSQAQIYKES